MKTALQGSLLDESDEAGLGPLGPAMRRTRLSHGAWVDFRPGWIAGADALFERLAGTVPWRAERRMMYDRVVDVPRLLCFYAEGQTDELDRYSARCLGRVWRVQEVSAWMTGLLHRAVDFVEQIGLDRDEHNLDLFVRAAAHQLIIPNHLVDRKRDILLRFKRNDPLDFFLLD